MRKFDLICLMGLFALSACNNSSTPLNLRLTPLPATQLQSMQARDFSQPDPAVILQAVIKTLSLLDFQIVRVDEQSGLVEAIRLYDGDITQANVTLQKIGQNTGTGKTRIRITLRIDQSLVTDMQTYQGFFRTLSRYLTP